MRTQGTPSKASITNKTRPAGSFSSSYSQAGRIAGPVFYVYVFSLILTALRETLTQYITLNRGGRGEPVLLYLWSYATVT